MSQPTKTNLSQSYLKSILHYNEETGIFTWANGKGRIRAGSVAGTIKRQGSYWLIVIDYRAYFAHRLAWLYIHGRWPKQFLDHINGIKIDNRINNLREATKSQNSRNIGPKLNNKLKVKGVSRVSGCRERFRASIRINNKQVHLGVFGTIEEASEAYSVAAKKHHGEFARTA